MSVLSSSLTEQVLNGSVLLSFPIAVVAGIVAFLSPCVLPLVPAYLSYITGLTGLELTTKVARGRILWGTILFILGFSAVFISYGALFGGAGSVFPDRDRRDRRQAAHAGVRGSAGSSDDGRPGPLCDEHRRNPASHGTGFSHRAR